MITITKNENDELNHFGDELVGAMKGKDGPRFATLMDGKMADVKTKKGSSTSRAVGNATFLVRFGKYCDVSNTLIDAYYAGNSGPNKKNDIVNLQAIGGDIVNSLGGMQCNPIQVIEKLQDFVASFKVAPSPVATTMPALGTTMPTIAKSALPMPADEHHDEEDEEEEEEEVATATESKPLVFDNYTIEVRNAIQALTAEQVTQAKEVLLNTNKNGEGYEMTLSGKKTLTPKNLNNLREWDNGLLKVAADILAIAPKRNKKWTASNGTEYKTRTWFPELCGASDYQAAKKLTEQMAAYVILASDRNFWNARFGWSVSEVFRQGFRTQIGINEEVADSAVVGGQAQSWHWPLVANDWKPTSSSKISDEDFRSLDLGSLDSL